MNLDNFRKEHEKDFKILSVIDQSSNYNRVLVILQLKNGKFRCHRYVYHNKVWKLEIDWHKASIKTVFAWLSFPTIKRSINRISRQISIPNPPVSKMTKTLESSPDF